MYDKIDVIKLFLSKGHFLNKVANTESAQTYYMHKIPSQEKTEDLKDFKLPLRHCCQVIIGGPTNFNLFCISLSAFPFPFPFPHGKERSLICRIPIPYIFIYTEVYISTTGISQELVVALTESNQTNSMLTNPI